MLTSSFVFLSLTLGVSGAIHNPAFNPFFGGSNSDASNLRRRDYGRFVELQTEWEVEYKQRTAKFPDLAKCWFPLFDMADFPGTEIEASEAYVKTLPEPCQRHGNAVEKILKQVASEHEEGFFQDDLSNRFPCLSAADADVQKTALECQRHYCPSGTPEGDKLEENQKINQELAHKWCPQVMGEWKKAMEEGYTRTVTAYEVSRLTVDGTKTTSTISPGSIATDVVEAATLPESAWDFTTKFTGVIPTATASPTESGEEKLAEETKEPESGASALKGAGIGHIVVGVSIAWVAFNSFF